MAFFNFLLPLILFLYTPLLSSASLYKTKSLFRSADVSIGTDFISASSLNDTAPTTFLEVTNPIQLPKTKPLSYSILRHEFAFTYGQPLVLASYAPPPDFHSGRYEKVVLEWTATCKGRQFDRILGVWLSGVEILRSCTAEPTRNGIVWTVSKDVTRYYSLFMSNQTMAVSLNNIVDDEYTGVYHVTVTFDFYPAERKRDSVESVPMNYGFSSALQADTILPISKNLPMNDGLWFKIQNSTDIQSKEFKIPQNAYRAVLEVYVSFHEKDEFWYTNMYDDYIAANNLSGVPGNGPFREVLVSLDGVLAGSIWPFPVIYTGGINPLLWRPISGIGSFDLPSYNIEITPFLGDLLDSKTHSLGFSVTNALNVWFIDANLHLWLDKRSAKTQGKLTQHVVTPLTQSISSNFRGVDGTFSTNFGRKIASSGWVKSSYGTTLTESTQVFNYTNFMAVENEGNKETVTQVTDYNDKVDFKFKMPSSSSHISLTSLKNFPLAVITVSKDRDDETSAIVYNVSRRFNEKKKVVSDIHGVLTASFLKNFQQGSVEMVVNQGNEVVGLSWSTRQNLKYNDDKLCYFRNISSSDYAIVHDEVRNGCSKMIMLQR